MILKKREGNFGIGIIRIMFSCYHIYSTKYMRLTFQKFRVFAKKLFDWNMPGDV